MKEDIDIARRLIWCAKKKGITLDRRKLQQLLFLLYGHYLAKNKQRPFKEQPITSFEGPIFPHIDYWSYTINPFSYFHNKEINIDNNRVDSTIEEILNKYGKYSSTKLAKLLAEENSPYWSAINEGEKLEVGNIIDDNVIKTYYNN